MSLKTGNKNETRRKLRFAADYVFWVCLFSKKGTALKRENQAMRIAILGCGHIAATHAAALAGLGQELALCVDRDEDTARQFAARWGFAAFDTRPEAVLDAALDCVHLCTPPTLHYEMARAILQAGKHLICEKPLCFDPAEARALYRQAQEKGLLAAVNFNVRFNAACQAARALVAGPDFGPPHLICGSYKQEFHTLPGPYGWRYLPALAGPMRAVTEIGSHWIDLARFWTGREIEAVAANFGRFDPRRVLQDGRMLPDEGQPGEKLLVESEDAAAITLRFAGGALGSLLLSEVSHGRKNELRLEVSSRGASVWWNSEDPYRLHQSQGGPVQTEVNAFAGGFPDSFAALFAAVYRALEAGDYQDLQKAPFPSFYDGWQNAAVCAAIQESAQKDGAWVAVQTYGK